MPIPTVTLVELYHQLNPIFSIDKKFRKLIFNFVCVGELWIALVVIT